MTNIAYVDGSRLLCVILCVCLRFNFLSLQTSSGAIWRHRPQIVAVRICAVAWQHTFPVSTMSQAPVPLHNVWPDFDRLRVQCRRNSNNRLCWASRRELCRFEPTLGIACGMSESKTASAWCMDNFLIYCGQFQNSRGTILASLVPAILVTMRSPGGL